MKEIVCDLNGFILKKPIYISDGETLEKQGAFLLKDLKKAVYRLAEENNIYTIRILGNDKYAEKFGQELAAANTNFSEEKFTIKFNNDD